MTAPRLARATPNRCLPHKIPINRLFLVLACAVVVTTAEAKQAPPAQVSEEINECVLAPDPQNDGDSFLVRLPDGRNATFRLYFVDAAEEHLSGKRATRQVRYFRITPGRLALLGKQARVFTERSLAQPFTVFTRWQSNFDEGRYFAFVQTADGKDLAELLVRSGLAIPRGERATTPYGRGVSVQVGRLRELERLAQRDCVGGWAQP